MKRRQSRRQTARVSHSRWLAYATASAATAVAGSNSLEAAIHYSGRLEVVFPRHETLVRTFQLDQPGDSLVFRHSDGFFDIAEFRINGIASASFRGRVSSLQKYDYVSKL